MNRRDEESREFLVREIAHVLSRSDQYDLEATKLDLAWALRSYSLYSPERTRDVLAEGAQRACFKLEPSKLEWLSRLLYLLSREDCSTVSRLNKSVRRLEARL